MVETEDGYESRNEWSDGRTAESDHGANPEELAADWARRRHEAQGFAHSRMFRYTDSVHRYYHPTPVLELGTKPEES